MHNLLGLELVVVLGGAILACGVLDRRLRIAPPVLLLTSGVLLGFIPALREVHLPPETMLLLFLPALLYWESLTTSLREIRSNLRPIALLSTVLVVATAGAVAGVAHGLGLPWGPAWVLGAAVAPTDATAVGVLARALPRRMVTMLRAESLINDGTALVVYGLAVGFTVGDEELSLPHVSGLFLLSYGGGILAGLVAAWLAVHVGRRLEGPLHANVAVLVTPLLAYLLSELQHASGVLAVVLCGLIMSQVAPREGRPDTRQQTAAFWSLATFALNGDLFILVGLEVQAAARNLTSVDLLRGVIAVVAVSAVVIASRFAWLFTTPYLIRALDRRPQQRARRVGSRPRVVMAVAGFRGAVSLALALAVPQTLNSGEPFPGRDLIVFVTAGGHRRHPRPGPAAAADCAVGSAGPRHLCREGTAPRPDPGHRSCPRRHPAAGRRPRRRPGRRPAPASGVRPAPACPTGRRSGRRRWGGSTLRPAGDGAAPGNAGPQARHRGRPPRRGPHRRHRAPAGPVASRR